MELEKSNEINKRTILELYLNKINFGGNRNIRGVQKASEYYFGKDVSELNLAESAMLAGIINAPNAYNPFNNLELATERRNQVLYLMNYHGYISDDEYKLAKNIKVEDLLVDYSKNKGSMIIRPYGYAIWENMVSILDKEFKRLGKHFNGMQFRIKKTKRRKIKS